MGHIENEGKSANQPKEGALDTNEDKGVDESEKTEEAQPAATEETSKPEETEEPTESREKETETEAETEEKPVIEAPGAEEEEAPEAKKEEVVAEEVEEVAPEEEAEELEEEKKERREALEEEEIVEERIYTIPLRRVWIAPRKKRAPRAVRMVKSFIQRHMKVETGPKEAEEEEEERLVISNEVNERLWSRGIEKPPRNIRVRAVKDKEGTVTVYLAEGD